MKNALFHDVNNPRLGETVKPISPHVRATLHGEHCYLVTLDSKEREVRVLACGWPEEHRSKHS